MRIANLIVSLFLAAALTACGQQSPKFHEAHNQCFTGFKWEECGASGEHPPTTLFIHKPTKGCPAGYKLAAKFFTEEDGTHRDGCVKLAPYPGAELPESQDGLLIVSVDMLYGGESFIQSFDLQGESDEPPRKKP